MHSNDINFYIIESRKTWHNMQLRVLSSIETEIKFFENCSVDFFFFQFIFRKVQQTIQFLVFWHEQIIFTC